MTDIIERLERQWAALDPVDEYRADVRDAITEIRNLRAELETERMRLAACGVVALANTPDSAKEARLMKPEYWSASCGDVARMVDEQMRLRAELDALRGREPASWMNTNGAFNHMKQAERDALHGAAMSKLTEMLRAAQQSAIPDVLFDGYAVYRALGKKQARTSPENVSDVLDAVVRLIRAAAPKPGDAK